MPTIKTYTGSLDDDLLVEEMEPNQSGIGIFYPLGINGRPWSSTYTSLDTAKSNVKMLLQTELGERVMMPEIGVRLKDLLFENFTEQSIITAKDRIRVAIDRWVPYVNIDELNVAYNKNAGIIKISLRFSLKEDISLKSYVDIIRR